VTELNFPDARPPVFRFYEEEDIQKDRAERDEILSKQGVRLTAAYYQRAYNLKEDDFELGAAEQGAAFQEEVPRSAGLPRGQRAIDELIERMAGRRDALDPMLQPVLDRVAGATSFEEIMEQLYELYPRMDTGRFEELLRQALFAADLWGYVRAKEEHGARRSPDV
jgi:hypothetical protein